MFYCDNCQIKNKYPESIMQSYGNCEICGELGACHDVQSKLLSKTVVGIKVTHTISENQELYDKYCISGSEHNVETSELCEIIRKLEQDMDSLKNEIDSMDKELAGVDV